MPPSDWWLNWTVSSIIPFRLYTLEMYGLGNTLNQFSWESCLPKAWLAMRTIRVSRQLLVMYHCFSCLAGRQAGMVTSMMYGSQWKGAYAKICNKVSAKLCRRTSMTMSNLRIICDLVLCEKEPWRCLNYWFCIVHCMPNFTINDLCFVNSEISVFS